MIPLQAYFDLRPLLFLAGLPLFFGAALLLCRLIRAGFPKRKIFVFSTLSFTILFALFLTGFGPFVDQEETRAYAMTWEIKTDRTEEDRETEVVLSFVDFPGHYIGEYSDELAAHLQEKGDREVKVVFEVTSDYGNVRGFHATEIAGLPDWKSESGYAGARGNAEDSPWD